MKRITHILFAVALTASTGIWETQYGLLFTLIVAVSSLIPDLDLRKNHRRLLHNVLLPLIIAVCLRIGLSVLGISDGYIVSAFLIGWMSHIFLDSLTKRGVALFYPINRNFYGFKICESNSLLFNIVISAISIMLIIHYLRAYVFM